MDSESNMDIEDVKLAVGARIHPELVPSIGTLARFLGAFSQVASRMYPRLLESPLTMDPDDLRTELSLAVSESFAEIGIEEPHGEGLDALGPFHDWIGVAFPEIDEALTE